MLAPAPAESPGHAPGSSRRCASSARPQDTGAARRSLWSSAIRCRTTACRPGAPEMLFRIAQEMLANVARHSRASRVRLWLDRQKEAGRAADRRRRPGFRPGGGGLRHGVAEPQGARRVAPRQPGDRQRAGSRGRVDRPHPPGRPRLRCRCRRSGGAKSSRNSWPWTAAAGLVSWPLWTGSGAEGAAAGRNCLSQDGRGFGGSRHASLIAAVAWLLGRSSPSGARRFVNRKGEILLVLCLGGWWIQFAPDLQASTARSSGPCRSRASCYAAGALVWVHRASEVRRVWREGALGPGSGCSCQCVITLAVTVASDPPARPRDA